MVGVCWNVIMSSWRSLSRVQIRQAASGLELTEEQFVELQSQHWARFYSICVQYQQVAYTLCMHHWLCEEKYTYYALYKILL